MKIEEVIHHKEDKEWVKQALQENGKWLDY